MTASEVSNRGLQAQAALSPGQRPGSGGEIGAAPCGGKSLKSQCDKAVTWLLPLQGAAFGMESLPRVPLRSALGYGQDGPSARYAFAATHEITLRRGPVFLP